MKLNEFINFPRLAKREADEEFRAIVSRTVTHLEPPIGVFICNELELAKLARHPLLVELDHDGEAWRNTLHEHAFPDEWVFELVKQKVIPAIRGNIEGMIEAHYSKPEEVNNPKVHEAIALHNEMGTEVGIERIANLIMTKKMEAVDPNWVRSQIKF